ncbi:MAG: Hsp20/alpha crystallin family protein [Deltaproteobacteria bacterium]|jgi:HSP20 family protein|nr:Hsp20/alpha crystallin family protein [Deltaproteobacteria bacterium]MBT4643106.1 Hsp20/alpha crystallin family protein [Deltaproteobacteria bacterium]MBT6498999.1 Hsp20/alpha crystallin family protein [Deltaproteobacteria bacterium]MBT6613908.1 Hsp20/alpha crystallin family protein [Deltaproteobacteria bacterium]MBT7155731.1 Hsp20/alpha crystallin family protein [Deltaproteobacteria bacterium]
MSEDTNKMVVENKKEVSLEKAQTIPGKQYIPATDIAETDKELLLYMDMPGVDRKKVEINLNKNVLSINGQIDYQPNGDLKLIYSEYNSGHFTRRFELSNEIDQTKIEARMNDGVLFLKLPKVPEKQPTAIEVN